MERTFAIAVAGPADASPAELAVAEEVGAAIAAAVERLRAVTA